MAVATCFAQEGAKTERWAGELRVGTAKLCLGFTIKTLQNGGQSCTMDVPEQGVKDLPVELKTYANDSLVIAIGMLNASYAGSKVSSGSIEGVFSQHGMSLPLVLKAGGLDVKRPQTPVAPFPYATEEVTFCNEAGGAVLSGTLTYPVNDAVRKDKSVPVVLMVTGSGSQNRDEEMFGHRPFWVIADFLARNGIATLRYDDRGVGKSTGPTRDITTAHLLADAEAGVDYLRRLKRFGKVGVLGHSEGGTIAFMMGANKSVDFLISLAGSATSGIDMIVGQNKALMQLQGVAPAVISDYATALNVLYRDRVALKSIVDTAGYVDRICMLNQLQLPAHLKANIEKCITAGGDWFTWFLAYHPAEAIRRIKCPVMALNGSLDMQVLCNDHLPVIRKHLPKHKQHFVKEYASLNHLFQHCTPATALNYGAIEETISEEVLNDMQSWINSVR